MVSGGQDVILFEDQSFQLSRASDTEINISSGLAIKDDLVIHITEDPFALNFEEWENYVDANTGGSPLDSTGYYYILLEYNISRSLPSPKAYYKIIKDVADYYSGNTQNYIFLGCVEIIYSEGSYKISGDPINYVDPLDSSVVRPTVPGDAFIIDGGEIE
jgi:hypothetical protein